MTAATQYRAVFFDFDGTLANTEKLAVYATQAAFAQMGLPVPTAAAIIQYQGIPIETSFPLLAQHPMDQTMLQQLFTAFRSAYQAGESAETIQAFSGIPELLTQLAGAGQQLFLMTSKKSAVAQRNLAILSLDKYFTAVYGSDRVVAYKPAPGGLQQALAEYQLSANEAVMVGDATFDIDAGNAAGMTTIAVTWGAHTRETLKQSEPDYLVATREALAEVLHK